jgi:hypothetical protein
MSQSKDQILRAAIQAVFDGCPKNDELARLAARNKLKFNSSTVAKEAGVSRTLVSGQRCSYPHIRDEIEALTKKTPLIRTLQDLILRNEKLLTTVVLQRHSLAQLFSKLRRQEPPLTTPELAQLTAVPSVINTALLSKLASPVKVEIQKFRLLNRNIEKKIARRDALYAQVVITALAWEQGRHTDGRRLKRFSREERINSLSLVR